MLNEFTIKDLISDCKKDKEYTEAFDLTKKIVGWHKRREEQDSLFIRVCIALADEYLDHNLRIEWENVKLELNQILRS